MRRISILGLGYVGSTLAAALSSQGHTIIGVDPDGMKRDAIDRGESPVLEPEITEHLSAGRSAGLIRTTAHLEEAISNSELAFVCVGTPSGPDGDIDLSAIRRVTGEIAASLRTPGAWIGIVYRSTMIPGTMDGTVLPELDRHASRGSRFDVAYYPEFMREGSGWDDHFDPPKIVVGIDGDRIRGPLAETFPATGAPLHWTDFRTAEMVKYADNAFHAAKITFANEMGILAQALGVDARLLMRIFTSDRRLNISPTYLRPGFAYGGSCLGKDLKALLRLGASLGLRFPLLSGIPASNEAQIERVLEAIRERNADGPVGFIGLAFKAGTDDLRESPYLRLAAAVAVGGREIIGHDPGLRIEKLAGANLRHAERVYPGLKDVLVASAGEVWNRCRLVVVGHAPDEAAVEQVRRFVERGGLVVDLVGSEFLKRTCGDACWRVV